MAQFNSVELDIPHSEMEALAKAGKLRLGINDVVADRIMVDNKLATSGAGRIWGLAALAVVVVGIVLAFVVAWWWLVLALGAGILLSRKWSQANRATLLKLAHLDSGFYERVAVAGGWLYEMADDGARYRRPSNQSGS